MKLRQVLKTIWGTQTRIRRQEWWTHISVSVDEEDQFVFHDSRPGKTRPTYEMVDAYDVLSGDWEVVWESGNLEVKGVDVISPLT